MRILLVSPPSGDLTIGLKHIAKVEPQDVLVIPRWIELLSPTTVILYEAHRPWREMFDLPYVDLEEYAAKLAERFRQIQFVPLITSGVRRINS
jgi:hypothetical protein